MENATMRSMSFGEETDRHVAEKLGITYDELLAERKERRLVFQDFFDTDWTSLLKLPFEVPHSP